MIALSSISFFFFFNDTATTEIYTLSLHDALPIFLTRILQTTVPYIACTVWEGRTKDDPEDKQSKSHLFPDRKSTRLNSSHLVISYAVFCLKKKKSIR